MKLNLPTKITLVRIFMIPIFVLVFFLDTLGEMRFLIAAIVFALAAATDALDGHIARSRGLVTNLGKFLDPIADKVLVSTAMILLLAAKEEFFGIFGGYQEITYIAVAVAVCIIMARELIISAFRQIAAVNGVVMAADKLGKLKTIFQDVSLVAYLAGAAFAYSSIGVAILYLATAAFAIATILTVWSGIAYVVNNSQVLKDTN